MHEQRLPTELLERIVDKLAEAPRDECLPTLISCATASSAMKDISQKYIFETVTMHSPYSTASKWYQHRTLPTTDERGSLAVIHSLCNRTKLLVATLARNPRLGLYARKLIFRFNSQESQLSEADLLYNRTLLDTIDNLPNLVSLDCGTYDRTAWPLQSNSVTDKLYAVIHRPTLRSLRLYEARCFHVGTLEAAPGLQELFLMCCVDWRQRPGIPKSGSPLKSLKLLTCDWPSLYFAGPSKFADLSQIQELDFIVDAFRDLSEGSRYNYDLLSKAECLRELKMTFRWAISHAAASRSLRCLNSLSFRTLSHLDMRFLVGLGSASEPEDANYDDPYFGSFGTSLFDLEVLEYLRIETIIQWDTWKHGFFRHIDAWLAPTYSLSRPGSLPKLSAVSILARIRVAMYGEYKEDTTRSARELYNWLCDTVKPKFHKLETSRVEQPFNFSFGVAISEEPYISDVLHSEYCNKFEERLESSDSIALLI
ncbi:hypothetical protein NMY22_g16542 [Coprinellus aureogranulatus]|nr:hypothetical protein NMY22_g16542 [Coprinellus aureogranulatus]